jgi:hypothetical protein
LILLSVVEGMNRSFVHAHTVPMTDPTPSRER